MRKSDLKVGDIVARDSFDAIFIVKELYEDRIEGFTIYHYLGLNRPREKYISGFEFSGSFSESYNTLVHILGREKDLLPNELAMLKSHNKEDREFIIDILKNRYHELDKNK